MDGEIPSPALAGAVPAPARERLLFRSGLAALLILGAVLRLHDLGGPAFDGDELYALRIQGLSPAAAAAVVGRSAFHDLHPPLSYLLFLPWIALFGPAESAVRSLPLLLGVVSIALLGLLGRRIGGTWMGLAAAAFLAFNPLNIAYSQEARPYALAVALTLAAHLFFLRSLAEPAAWNRTAYALLAAAALYTHYFALFALLPHGLIALWLLLRGDEGSRRAARPTLLAFACALAAFIAWLPAFVFQATGRPEGSPLDIYGLGGSPLSRLATYAENAAGLGAPPFLLPALAALLLLVAAGLLPGRERERLPAAPGAGALPPRWLGAAALLAGGALAMGLHLAAPRLLPPARQMLLAKGYTPGAVERELHGLLAFSVSLPLAAVAVGLLALAWPWLSSLPDRLPGIAAGRGRPLAVHLFLACLLLVPVAVVLVLALRGVPMLSDRNLLMFEPALALALGRGAVRLAGSRSGRPALAAAILCLALAGFQYQALSGPFGVRGKRLGLQTGAWRDLARAVDRRGRTLPLVVADTPGSDPAEFYLQGHRLTRIADSRQLARAGLPGEFRFVHLKGNHGSEALLADLSGMATLAPELQVDEFVIYDARPAGRSQLAATPVHSYR